MYKMYNVVTLKKWSKSKCRYFQDCLKCDLGLEPGSPKLHIHGRNISLVYLEMAWKFNKKKCFYSKRESENPRNYGHQKIWKFIIFLRMEKNTFNKYISYGYFFSPNCKNKSVFIHFMFSNGNQKNIFLMCLTVSYKLHHMHS